MADTPIIIVAAKHHYSTLLCSDLNSTEVGRISKIKGHTSIRTKLQARKRTSVTLGVASVHGMRW